ncbi:TPA: DUF551 domain-containing protein, partial [Escherichia coli]
LTFEQWLEQQHDKIDVDCGCVSTEMFMHWIRVAYEAGNSPATPDGWIPVSERMPEPYEYVLVTDGFDGCEVMRVNTDGYWGPAKSLYPGSITHWMPLPAAPQQEVK